jgi:phage shock protein PspC (stress-responsive transcriptional regulator)
MSVFSHFTNNPPDGRPREGAAVDSGYKDTHLERQGMNHSRDEYHQPRFYRDSERGVIFGVCAGIAGSLGWQVWLVRIAALALGGCFPISVVVTYVVAAAIMPQRPLRYCGDGDERTCWQSRRQRS